MASFFGGILNLTLGVVILSGVYISTVKATNTTGWTTSEIFDAQQNAKTLNRSLGSSDSGGYRWSGLRSDVGIRARLITAPC